MMSNAHRTTEETNENITDQADLDKNAAPSATTTTVPSAFDNDGVNQLNLTAQQQYLLAQNQLGSYIVRTYEVVTLNLIGFDSH